MYPEEQNFPEQPLIVKQSNWTCSAVQSQPTFLCSAGSEPTTVHTKCRVRQGPRAATLRQTTLRLLCRAQLAQSTSKSLSQNIVGKLRINKACNNKQLVATHSHAQLSDALMHTHTPPSGKKKKKSRSGVVVGPLARCSKFLE